jgi:integrase/recombinase XerD
MRHAQALSHLAAICMTLATGRRISGITDMRVEAIDLDRNEVRIDWEKGHMGRLLPVAAWAMEVIGWYLREARPLMARGHDSPWLFLDRTGAGPVQAHRLGMVLRELVQDTCRENPDLTELPGKRISWHSLRVSFATLLFQNGCDIRSVNELLLHKSLATTSRYCIVPVEDLRQVFQKAHPRA